MMTQLHGIRERNPQLLTKFNKQMHESCILWSYATLQEEKNFILMDVIYKRSQQRIEQKNPVCQLHAKASLLHL